MSFFHNSPLHRIGVRLLLLHGETYRALVTKNVNVVALPHRSIAFGVGRTVVGSAIAVAAAFLLLQWTQARIPPGAHGLLERGALVFLPLAGSIALYLAVTRLMRMEELGWLLGRRGARRNDGGAS